MKSDEFNELQKFGSELSQKPKQEFEKKESISVKQTNEPIEINLSDIFKRIIIGIFKIGKWFCKKIYRFFNLLISKIKRWNNLQKIETTSKFSIFKKKKYAYKIVETKKVKRNKVIIIRRRVPLDLRIGNTQFEPIRKGAVYYLSIKKDENGIDEIKPVAYPGLRSSVWDFPIGRKRK